MPISTTKLGHIVLRVRDLARSTRFYTEVLGLRKAGEIPGLMAFFTTQSNTDSHDLALMQLGPDAADADPQRVGLYHFAYQVGSEEALAEAYHTLRDAGVPIVGTGDHGVSKGIYILDPASRSRSRTRCRRSAGRRRPTSSPARNRSRSPSGLLPFE